MVDLMNGVRGQVALMIWAVLVALAGGMLFMIGKANEPESTGRFEIVDGDHWSYVVQNSAGAFLFVAVLMFVVALVRLAQILGRSEDEASGDAE